MERLRSQSQLANRDDLVLGTNCPGSSSLIMLLDPLPRHATVLSACTTIKLSWHREERPLARIANNRPQVLESCVYDATHVSCRFG
jgi:hypothetical protein